MRLKIKTLTLLFSLLFAACNNPSIESLAISPKSATINIGETLQINVISTPVYENSAFTWSSTDNGVAR
ncbi:MAG: Ig-like domain-containing protein [Alistipes sp.]|nr:Ig-like domain-containing protein [Alistipes sp.]